MLLRRRPDATLDDVVEYLRGIGVMMLFLHAKLERIVDLLEGSDGDE